MSTVSANTILDATGGNTATINGATPTAYNTMGKNRIINGAMEIDQRNAGASVSVDGGASYTLDRYLCQDNTDGSFSVQRSTTAPTGFVNSLLVTITGTDSSLTTTQFGRVVQRIEGTSISDLAWGTASAKSVTLSFWVRSSVTGTFGGSLNNNDGNRIYAFTYTISSANTWEQKTVTVAGDTTGTWLTTTGTGIELNFGLGAGPDRSVTAGSWGTSLAYNATGATNLFATSGATWYITGVQLEVGSVATEFERRPYTTELALCQRYFWKWGGDPYTPWGIGSCDNANVSIVYFLQCPVPMRTSPTLSMGGANRVFPGGSLSSNTLPYSQRTNQTCYFGISATGVALNNAYIVGASNDTSAYFQGDAEL